MSSTDDDSVPQAKRMVFEILEELLGARNRFRDEEFANNGSASEDAYTRFCARIVQTADYLSQFADEGAVDDEEFEEFFEAVEAIKSRRGETVTVERPAPGDTSAMQSSGEPVPAILMLDGEWLIDVSRQAERICKNLGWGPTVTKGTHRTEIDDELIEEVEKWRKQNLE